MDFFKTITDYFSKAMKSEDTLFMYLIILVIGVLILLFGMLYYAKNKNKLSKGKFNKYMAIPIFGIVIVGFDLLQIAMYLLVW